MPRPLTDHDPGVVLEAERDIRIRLGDRSVQREVRAASSYLASNDPRVHFGLGDVDQVESVSVLWPDGKVERYTPITVDQISTLRYGEGQLLATP